MASFTQEYTIKAPLAEVWESLTDGPMAEQWGAGPASVDARVGGEFSYWDGDIHGITTKIETEKLLEQDWYEHDHPEHLHKVTFTFEASATNTTKVQLTQTDVGDDELTNMIDGWQDYYIDPIKNLLEKTSE